MMLFPEAQRKAQEELDSVLGTSARNEVLRLPTFDEKGIAANIGHSANMALLLCSHSEGRLPYLGALIQEVHWWHPGACCSLAS
jgi:hypothetical protein